MPTDYIYPGEELALFEHATRWKKYFASFIIPLLKGRVLEAGAGIGATTQLLNNNSASRWVLLEPDERMAQQLQQKIQAGQLPSNCHLFKGTLGTLAQAELFDHIIYIDVLEHIEHDHAELARAAAHVAPGGYITVLSPAFGFLYSPFDKAIGHYRRYTKKTLRAAAPPALNIQRICYLDTVGYFASLLNKLLLRQSYPTQKQVQLWDKWMVPVSRVTDPVFFYSFGKSILATWKKP